MPNPQRGPYEHEITVRSLPAEAWEAPIHARSDGERGHLYRVTCARTPSGPGAFRFLIEQPYVGIDGPGTRPIAWVAGWDGDYVFLPLPADSVSAWAVPASDVAAYVKE